MRNEEEPDGQTGDNVIEQPSFDVVLPQPSNTGDEKGQPVEPVPVILGIGPAARERGEVRS